MHPFNRGGRGELISGVHPASLVLLSRDRGNRLSHQREIRNRQRGDDIRVARSQDSKRLPQLDEQDSEIVLSHKRTAIFGGLSCPEINFVGFLNDCKHPGIPVLAGVGVMA